MKRMMIILVIVILTVFSKKVPYVGNPIVENCVACKFIWENIEEALMNVPSNDSFLSNDDGKRNPILTAQAFQYFCKIAPDIFYDPCNLMFEKLYFMTQDFCARKKIAQLCIDNDFCPKNI
jgi:hypothetical protein